MTHGVGIVGTQEHSGWSSPRQQLKETQGLKAQGMRVFGKRKHMTAWDCKVSSKCNGQRRKGSQRHMRLRVGTWNASVVFPDFG